MSRPRSLLRRLVRIALFGLAFLLIALIGLYLLRGPILSGPLGGVVGTQLSSALGGRFEAKAVNGSWFGDIELVALKTHESPAAGALTVADVGKAYASYDLMTLLGDRPLDGIEELRVEGLRLELDLTRPPVPDETPPKTLREIVDLIPRTLPNVDVAGSLLIKMEQGSVNIPELSVKGSGESLLIRLGGLVLPAGLGLPPVESPEFRVARPTRDGISLSAEKPILDVELRKLAASVVGESGWQADLEVLALGGSITLKATPTRVDARFDRLSIANLPAWVRERLPESAGIPESGIISGSVTLPDPLSERLIGAVELAIDELAWPKLSGGRISVKGGINGETFSIASLDASLGDDARATARNVTIDPRHGLYVSALEQFEVTVPDVFLLLDRLGITLEEVPTPLAPVSLAASLASDGDDKYAIRQIAMTTGANRIELKGQVTSPTTPEDWKTTQVALDLDATFPDLARIVARDPRIPVMTGSATATGRVVGAVLEPKADLNIVARDLVVEGESVGAVDVVGLLEWPKLALSKLNVVGDVGTLNGSGRFDLEERSVAEVALVLDIPDLARAGRILRDAPPLAGSLKVNGSGTKTAGPWESGYDGSLVLTGTGLRVDGHDVGTADANVAVAWPDVTISALKLVGALAVVDVIGHARIEGDLPEVVADRFDVRVPDLSALRSLSESIPVLAGALEITGNAKKVAGAPWESIEGRFAVRGDRLAWDGTDVGQLTLAGVAAGRAFSLENLEASGEWGSATLAGTVRLAEDGGGQAEIQQLKATLGEHAIVATKPIQGSWTKGSDLDVPAFELNALSGTVTGSGRMTGNVLALDLRVVNADLAGLPNLELGGLINVDVAATGTLAAPTFTVKANSDRLTWRDVVARLAVDLRQDATSLDILTLNATVEGGGSVTASGRVPVLLSADGMSRLPFEIATLKAEVTALKDAFLHRFGLPTDVSFNDAHAVVSLDEGTLKLDGEISNPAYAYQGTPTVISPTITLLVVADPTTTRATLRSAEGQALFFEGDATLALPIDWNDPEGFAKAALDAPLTGNVAARIPELNVFESLVPGIKRLAGRLDLALAVSGTANAPVPKGSLKIDDLTVRLDADVPTLDEGRIHLGLDERRVTMDDVRVMLGFSELKLTGSVEHPLLGGPAWAMNVTAKGDNVLLMRTQYVRARADLDVNVKGPLEALVCSGVVNVTDALISQPISLVGSSAPTANDRRFFSIREAPLSTMRFDVLRITSKEGIRMRNNLINGDISADVSLAGTGAVPQPDGRVFFNDVKVQLPFSKLNVDRGDLVFQKDDPFSPRISVAASTRMRGYDLEVSVQGRLPNQKTIVRSDPFLPPQDALLLLTVGSTREGLQDEGLGRAGLTRVGSLAGSALLSALTGPGNPDEESLTDRISLEVGADVSRSGASTIEIEYQLLESLYLAAERDRYDDYNLGAIWRLSFK